MKITIRVKTNARKNEVVQTGPDSYAVSVTAPPVEGKANEKIVELLAEHFDRPKRCVSIVRGEHAKQKTVEIQI